MRIPYDSFVLGRVVSEFQTFLGGRVQGVRQSKETEVVLELYANGREGMFLISVHAQFFRAHFVTRKPRNAPNPLQFCSALRSKLVGCSIVSARQVGQDRVLKIVFEGSDGLYSLVIELMGKHSNAMLLDGSKKIVGAAKWLGPSKTSRPISPGREYVSPPTAPAEGGSKFYRTLLAANGGTLPPLSPTLVLGSGAYPVALDSVELQGVSRPTLSLALEQHYEQAILDDRIQAARNGLNTHLDRAILAREVAIHDLRDALDKGAKAERWQRLGELILAYGPSMAIGASILDAYDYEGNPIAIPVNPELTYKENSSAYFLRARKAKDRLPFVKDQLERHAKELSQIQAFKARVADLDRLDEILELQDEAKNRKWLRLQTQASGTATANPLHEGHKIREILGPKGSTIFYGENSESNDYLTMRMAKPDDWWIHVRGHTSAHVLIPTNRHPEKVPQEDLLYAAQVAVMNSSQKHGSYVPVDYTLRKYVRKPRGSGKGAVVYTHEKTFFVDPIAR